MKTNDLRALTRIKPEMVVMPIVMITIGAICILTGIFLGNSLLFSTIYWSAAALFVFIPVSTIDILIPLYNKNKKRFTNILLRKLITAILVLVFVFAPAEYRQLALILAGLGGMAYFFLDYVKQGKFSLQLDMRLREDVPQKKFYDTIYAAMATKCSRSVLREYVRRLPEGKKKARIIESMEKTEFKWWHLFPFSKKSLTGDIFGIDF